MDGGPVHDARLGGCGGVCAVTPLGATVRWRDAIHKSAWSGVVTGHPRAKMVEVDGRGAISEGLLEVVDMDDLTPPHWGEAEEMKASMCEQFEEMRAERDGLTEIVTQQCEVIASMSADASEFKRLQDVEDDFQRLRDAVSDALLALTGTRRPSQRDCAVPEIWALAEAAEYFED